MSAQLKIQCHYEFMKLPARAHASDAGIDITAMAMEEKQDSVFMFDTGISLQVSEGYYVEVVPRSSIIKTNFIMANSVGIIDPEYRGRIFVPLRYVGHGNPVEAAEKLLNTRIAQLLIRPWIPCTVEQVEFLSSTTRDTGGFGSTGT
ncbi:dUTP pyrophosphatase [Deltaproteobacteria bacterium TL4]